MKYIHSSELYGPMGQSSPLKDRLELAISKLGGAQADVIKETETRLEAALGHFPTLKQRVDAFEKLASESRRSSPAPALSQPTTKTARGKSAAEIGAELCDKYQTLNSDEERRAFWQSNEKLLSDAKAKVPGLAQICMMAAKPLSPRAQSQLPMNRSAFEKLSPIERRELCKKGVTLFDTPSVAAQSERPRSPIGSDKVIARADFDALSPKDQRAFCLGGGKITDLIHI